MYKHNIFSAGAAKLLSFQQEICEWLASCNPTPITLEIHPSELCNQCCPRCQAGLALSKKEVLHRTRQGACLDLSLLNSLWEAPPKGIIISGNTGDPLLHPDIGCLLGTVSSMKIPTILITNGEALTIEIAEQIIRSCCGVRISLDAFDAASYRMTHGVDASSWDTVLRNLKTLLDCRQRIGKNKDDCTIGVGYLTGNNTISGMVPAASLARSIGVDYIQFRPFHYSSCSVESQLQQCEGLQTSDFIVLSSMQKYTRLLESCRGYDKCHGAWFYTVLDACGDLYLCCHKVGDSRAKYGSLNGSKWIDNLRSWRRKILLDEYKVYNCLPRCRLDSQNVALESVRLKGSSQKIELDSAIDRHAVFL